MWDAALYEQFSGERLRPSMDLTARLEGDPFAILDVGCGSGMSTWCLRQRFPYAKIKGVDLSASMLESAKKLQINADFFQKDCSKDLASMGMFDLVFSNAFIQWLEDQEAFIRDIRSNLNVGGVLAMQIPLFGHIPMSDIVKETVARKYKEKCEGVFLFHDFSVQEYYDMFTRYYEEVEIWKTSYIHQLDTSDKLVEFIQGTALIPYKERLTEEEYEQFLADLKAETRRVYPESENGKVLFPFERLFVIAGKPKK